MSMWTDKCKRKRFAIIAFVVLVLTILVPTCAIYLGRLLSCHADMDSIEAFAPMKEVSVSMLDDGKLIFELKVIFYPGGRSFPLLNGASIYREKRPEWSPIGMLGKLVAVDDGSCKVNSYCKPSQNGVAANSDERTNFRVLARIDENHVKILIL